MAADANSAEATSTLWEDIVWMELLAYLDNREVIPIVGPDLLQVEVDGKTLLFDRYLAGRLAQIYQLPADDLPAERPLNHVVVRLMRQGIRRAAIAGHICSIIDQTELPPPKPLRQLAEITDFDLFVTTTFDPLLQNAIDEVRFGCAGKTQALSYQPRNDPLPVKKKEMILPSVYYLMGKYSRDGKYVFSDEDLLEFVCKIQIEGQRPKIFDELYKNNLLILGADFPDWLARIFLRTAKGRPLSTTQELEVLADSKSKSDAGLVSFLLQFSTHTRVFRTGGAIEFVDELWKRWRENHPQSHLSKHLIFISYAREDLPAVQELKAGLNAAGLTVWFDLDKLKPGGYFTPQIQELITEVCCCFLAIISKNTEARWEGYFRREWNLALERQKGIFQREFIVPVLIDDLDKPRAVDPRFKELNYKRLPGGKVTDEFVNELKEIMSMA
jgi:hypothetical protein